MYGNDIIWTYCGEHFTIYKNIKSLHFIPETNSQLYLSEKVHLRSVFDDKGKVYNYVM